MYYLAVHCGFGRRENSGHFWVYSVIIIHPGLSNSQPFGEYLLIICEESCANLLVTAKTPAVIFTAGAWFGHDSILVRLIQGDGRFHAGTF